MKVSVVVPVYNTERYLHRCLESLRNQTLKDLEIILVDDGSEDFSGDICDKYAAEDARIHVIHKANGGLVSARQTGLSAATGEYVGFVDSDDWIEPDMYRTLYETAEYHGADIVAEGIIDEIGNVSRERRNLPPGGTYNTVEKKEKLYKSMISCQNFFCLGIQPYLCNKLIRRELAFLHMTKIPQSIRVGEDAAAVYPMLVQANIIAVSDTAYYHYCHRNTSIMLGIRQEEREYKNAMLLHSFLEKTFRELEVYEVTQEQLRRYTINNLLTRAYGKCAVLDRKNILFPFMDVCQGDTIIIYGAGAFGKAVYQYTAFCEGLKVKAWIDERAADYQRLGLDVQILEDVDIVTSDKIVIAVLSESVYWQIREKLMIKGILSEQIKWINMKKLLRLLI